MIRNFFSNETSSHSFGEVFLDFSSMTLPPYTVQKEFSTGLLLPIAQTLLLVMVLVHSIRKNHRFSAALCFLGLVMEVTAAISLKLVIGDLRRYLLNWISAVSLMNWIPIGATVFYQLRHKTNAGILIKAIRVASYSIVVILSCINSWYMIHTTLVRHDDPRVCPLTQQILSHLNEKSEKKPLLLIADHHKWGIASGVMLQLRKSNQTFAIQGWHPILQHEPAGNEDAYIWFTGRYLHAEMKVYPFNHLIAREENCFVYEVPLSMTKDPQTVWKMIEDADRETSGPHPKHKADD